MTRINRRKLLLQVFSRLRCMVSGAAQARRHTEDFGKCLFTRRILLAMFSSAVIAPKPVSSYTMIANVVSLSPPVPISPNSVPLSTQVVVVGIFNDRAFYIGNDIAYPTYSGVWYKNPFWEDLNPLMNDIKHPASDLSA